MSDINWSYDPKDLEIERYTEQGLDEWAKINSSTIRQHEKEIAHYKKLNEIIQAELDHRHLEAFWAAHPGLRLEAGDKLAHEFSNLPAYMPLYVESILMESEQIIAATRKDDWIAVGGGEYPFLSLRLPLVFARQMREAYLAQHPDSA